MSIWLPEIPTLTRRRLLKVGAVAISGFDLLPMLRPLNATVKEKLKGDAKGSRLGALLTAEPPKTNKEIVEELFLATLARFPSPEESAFGERLLSEYHAKGGEDLLWALINKPEFILNY